MKLVVGKFYQSQQEELQFLLRQLLTHDLYSVLPELNQIPSLYSQGPVDIREPNQQEELQFLLRQLLTHDLYSVLPELNQTPSLYSQGPVDIREPNDKSDPYGTKFTAKTVNDTAQKRFWKYLS